MDECQEAKTCGWKEEANLLREEMVTTRREMVTTRESVERLCVKVDGLSSADVSINAGPVKLSGSKQLIPALAIVAAVALIVSGVVVYRLGYPDVSHQSAK